jgi:hypothetical protein
MINIVVMMLFLVLHHKYAFRQRKARYLFGEKRENVGERMKRVDESAKKAGERLPKFLKLRKSKMSLLH